MSDLNNNRIKRQSSKNVAAMYGSANWALIKGTDAVSVCRPAQILFSQPVSNANNWQYSVAYAAKMCSRAQHLEPFHQSIKHPCCYLCIESYWTSKAFLNVALRWQFVFTLHPHQRLQHLSQLLFELSRESRIFASLILTIDGPNFPSHLCLLWCVCARA